MTSFEPNTTLQVIDPKEKIGAHQKGFPSDTMTPEVVFNVRLSANQIIANIHLPIVL